MNAPKKTGITVHIPGLSPVNDADAAARFALEAGADFPPVNLGTKRPGRVLGYMDGAALSMPVPPTPWLCRSLLFAPGRPTLWTAAAGTGKTWLGQSFGLSVAAGLSSWLDTFPIQKSGPVRHINLEMPRDEMVRRYQRLARGMRLDLAALPLRLINRADVPTGFSLMSDDVVDVLTEATMGARLCLIDSFRTFIGSMDENKSEVRACLDNLLTVQERTGCMFLVIHHEGKPPKEETGHSSQHKARGSSAIGDAVDLTWSIGEAGFPSGMKITPGKASMGQRGEPFAVRLIDIGEHDQDGRSEAIVVEYVPPEQAAEIGDRPAAERLIEDRILAALKTHGELNRADIIRGKKHDGSPAIVVGNKQAKERALKNLTDDGEIERSNGKGREVRYRLPG